MCELSNEQVFSNWQECNRENRQQGADYWHDFMSKRAKRGYKGAQAVVDKMDRLKQLRAHSLRVKQPTHNRQIEGSKPSGPTIF